jgi:hypothetical protein
MKAVNQKTNSISFDDGRKDFLINNDPNKVIRINTGDIGIVARIDEAKQEVEKVYNKYKDALDEQSVDAYKACDKEIRDIIDYVFDYPVCEAMIGNASILGVVDGIPVFIKIVDVLTGVIMPYLDEEQRRVEKNIGKYKAQADKIKESTQ